MEIDPRTGLPVEAIAWEDLAKSEQKITISTVARRYGKLTTLVSGFDNSIDPKSTARGFKEALPAAGPSRTALLNCRGNHGEASDQFWSRWDS